MNALFPFSLFFLIPFLGALLGALFAGAAMLYARRYLTKSFIESLQESLLHSMQAAPIPNSIKDTARNCMQGVVVRFREKMPFVGNFITPTLLQSMEEMMLEELRKHWPNLVQSMIPSIVTPLVEQGLHDPALTKFVVGYSSILGLLISLCVGLLMFFTQTLS